MVVAGAGIGGLAASLAATRAGWQVRVLEQAASLSEVGAGIQLGPNATRVLRDFGLLDAMAARAAHPQRLVARDAACGRELASLPLGPAFDRRYGAPYLTVHRADLQATLLQAVREAGVDLQTGARVQDLQLAQGRVRLRRSAASALEADAAVGADGLWSALRQWLLGDGPPRASDHVAWRALLPMQDVPAPFRAPEVHAWLGPRLHAVSYPVRAGEALNLVCVIEQSTSGDRAGWDDPAASAGPDLARLRLGGPLRELLECVPAWGMWVLHDRPPLAGPAGMARGPLALLGDAAHPMRPYLAQGAAMALEDAHVLGRLLATQLPVEQAFARYAQARWARCARVQRRSLRNGVIFHAAGPLRLARDASLRLLGARLMDLPWLYGEAPTSTLVRPEPHPRSP
nr:FAD-dependent monooxygenase [Ramlibacter aurantiacus]